MAESTELRDLSPEELAARKAAAQLSEKQARAALYECEQATYLIVHEEALRKIGLRLGDKVQVSGKIGGKQNPMGEFAGFEGRECYWPLVYLYKKDGKLSESASPCYGYNKLTKIDTPTQTF